MFALLLRNEGANIEYAFPREGSVIWMDNVVLLRDAPNRENALRFMDFLLEPEGSGTRVTWLMRGETEGAAALFSRVVPMDKLLGKDLERGLARLKAVAEDG